MALVFYNAFSSLECMDSTQLKNQIMEPDISEHIIYDTPIEMPLRKRGLEDKKKKNLRQKRLAKEFTSFTVR